MWTALLEKLDGGVGVLSQLFDLGTFDPDDASSQALMDQQAKFAVKVNPAVMLVLLQSWYDLQQNVSNGVDAGIHTQNRLCGGLLCSSHPFQ